MAAALHAPCVDFYKDVDAIYASDPKISNTVEKFSTLEYVQAKELAAAGAKILHLRSIELAQKNGIELRVRSFHVPDVIGTTVGNRVHRTKSVCFEEGGS